jgi:undecaprenyl-diphosphatase
VSHWEAIILGVIQGLTEFLPVSSSGHLTLGQHFLGLSDLHHYILFDLVCHLGTLLAIFVIFFSEIKRILIKDSSRLNQIILATLPLFPLALLIKPLHTFFDQPKYLGFCFLMTAFLLLIGIKWGYEISQPKKSKQPWRDSLIIGFFQAIAILPGISRSGSTISAARLLGWNRQDAAIFSFLLAIPAILGATILELSQLILHPQAHLSNPPMGWLSYALGFITSFVIGSLSLILLLKFVSQNKLMVFVWYCLFLGIVTIFYFNFNYFS